MLQANFSAPPMPDPKSYLVITAVGPDRPGIVSDLSRLIHSAGANLEDSRMAVLGGEFALLLLISGSEEALTQVEARGAEGEASLGLRFLAKRTSSPVAPKSTRPYAIKVSGLDRPGIVQTITQILARRQVNLRSVDSRLGHAPLSGTPLFVLEALLEVPSEVTLAELRRELVERCDEENLDLSLEALG